MSRASKILESGGQGPAAFQSIMYRILPDGPASTESSASGTTFWVGSNSSNQLEGIYKAVKSTGGRITDEEKEMDGSMSLVVVFDTQLEM